MGRSALYEFSRDALLSLHDDLYDSTTGYDVFTWRAGTSGEVDIRCVRTMQGNSVETVLGGHEEIADFALNVLTENFVTADSTIITVDSEVLTSDNSTPRPISGMKLRYLGKLYKVAKASLDSTRAYIRLELSDAYSGR